MMLMFPGYSSTILPWLLKLPKLLQLRSTKNTEKKEDEGKEGNTGICSPVQNRYPVWCTTQDSTNWSYWWLCHLLPHVQVLRVTHLIQPARWRRHWSSTCCHESKHGCPKRSMAQSPLRYIQQISPFYAISVNILLWGCEFGCLDKISFDDLKSSSTAALDKYFTFP